MTFLPAMLRDGRGACRLRPHAPRRRLPVAPRHLAAALLLALAAGAHAQQARPERGLRHVDPRWHALVGARVVVAPGEVLERATVVMRDGVITAVGADVEVPAGARRWERDGLTVYAGFIDPHVAVEAPRPDPDLAESHWNDLVTPQRSALDGEGLGAELRESLRALGFTAAALAPERGIFRGTAALVALADPADAVHEPGALVLARDVYLATGFDEQTFDWDRSEGARYPTSLMGAIALFRQTLADADWYAACQGVYAADPARHEPPAPNAALAALGAGAPRLLFDADDELSALRALDVAREFRRPLVLLDGSGTAFRRLGAIADAGVPVVAALAFPEEPNVATLAAAEQVSLRELMTWEQAPTNPRRLDEAGVAVSLTTSRLEKRKDFHANLRRAVEHGLSPERALAMLTTHPAELLGVSDRLGRVAPGMLAHLVVVDGDVLDEDGAIREVWVGGRRYAVDDAAPEDLDGGWSIEIARLGSQMDVATTMTIADGKRLELRAHDETVEARKVQLEEGHVAFLLDGADVGEDGTFAFSGVVEGDAMAGQVLGPDGVASWSAVRAPSDEVADAGEAGDGGGAGAEGAEGGGQDGEDAVADAASAADDGEDDGEDDDAPDVAGADGADVPEELVTPLGAYGLPARPPAETVLIAHATVWTSAEDGIIEDGSVLVRDGKIEYAGRHRDELELRADRVIDARGRHVTPGLIDCHSHTGMSAVNEAGERVTAEVRAEDVIDPDDVDWYRQLAGGLTAANQLHGSANAIGGQNAVVKLRWGAAHPRDMLLEGAPPGIKFALGENPKRVAANMRTPDEYPQTRMGVATLIHDRLEAARRYADEHARHAALDADERERALPPRRDLELEALAEVVAGERLIHCHSYRQDEILMLCKLADELGIRIGTFQHVLEGYKIAEAIAASAIGGSTFSDWWAYKFEVIDAIPHNAALMHDVGVTVSINSDSSEHARRLNTEAAKSMKYGGLEPAEALALVTINPAVQLGVADRVGSLEKGKDADLAVWSGSPLSYSSRCERTFVDGRELFSLERDAELRAQADAERRRIIQKLLAGERKGDDKDTDGGDEPAPTAVGGVDTPPPRGHARHDDELRGGPGDCGCGELLRALQENGR